MVMAQLQNITIQDFMMRTLLNTQHTKVREHGKIMLVPTWKLHP